MNAQNAIIAFTVVMFLKNCPDCLLVWFDPSDVELLEHLAAKCGMGNSEPHMFIEELIPTVDQEEGICYTHPENIPGSRACQRGILSFHPLILHSRMKWRLTLRWQVNHKLLMATTWIMTHCYTMKFGVPMLLSMIPD